MTVYRLKRLYESHNPAGLFFSKQVMEMFGDCIGNFSVKKTTVKAITDKGIEDLEVYDLVRKFSAGSGFYGHCVYFRVDNFKIVFDHT